MIKPSIPAALIHGFITQLRWSASIEDIKNNLGNPLSESNPEGDPGIPNILFYPGMELYFAENTKPVLEEILIQVWQVAKSKRKQYPVDFGWIHQKLTLSETIKKLTTLNLPHKVIYNSIANVHGVLVDDRISFTASEEALKMGDFLITRLLFCKERIEINYNVVKVLESFN
jgi:hypothetical protein